jgi:pSer/pThr/pTyr-binding forkhead associated (FHA) protein
MARLIMRRGPTPGAAFELDAEIITIGRGSKNGIVVNDNEVSREHCRLIRLMADYEVVDLDSSNGTFVNGARVEGTRLLQPGFLIELGDSITFEYERPAALGDATIEDRQVAIPRDYGAAKDGSDGEPASQPFLVLTHGPDPGHVYKLEGEKVSIGRDLTNSVVILYPEVSRFHVSLHWAEDTYIIEDLESTNGTMVNGEFVIEPRLLLPNDVIQIGTMVRLRYTWQPDDIEFEIDDRLEHLQTQPSRPPSFAPDVDTSKTSTNLIGGGKNRRTTTSRLGTGLEPGMLEDHLIIAYSRAQWEDIVAPLTVELQDAGLKVWVDQYLIPGGDDWLEAIEQALYECWLLLVVVTPDALTSPYVEMEYRYFFNREKPVVPLIYQDVGELPRELRKLKAVKYNARDHEKTMQTLIFEIMHLNR